MSRGKRLLLLIGSLLVSLLLAEALVRWLAPGHYEDSRILTLDGHEVPLQEVVHFLRKSGERERLPPGPRGRLLPHWKVRFKYDRPRWDYFDDLGCITLTSNSLGFRDLEFSLEKAPGELRILALGDSFTFGQGVQLEDTWPQVLEARLRGDREGPVEVINAGFATGGYSPPGYVGWLASDGLLFSPDLVIVGYCLNDMGNVPMLAYAKAAPKPWLGGVSELLNYVQLSIEQRRLMSEEHDFTEIVRADSGPWERAQAALLEMRDLLRERGIGFAVAVFPMLSRLGDDYPYLGLHEMVDAFCRENEIPCVDLLPRFRGLVDEDLWVHPTDQHPNDVAQRLMADGIYEFLSSERLVR